MRLLLMFVWKIRKHFFLIFVALEPGLEIHAWSGWCPILLGAHKAGQAVLALLQPAVTGAMTVEKQSTRTDDC